MNLFWWIHKEKLPFQLTTSAEAAVSGTLKGLAKVCDLWFVHCICFGQCRNADRVPTLKIKEACDPRHRKSSSAYLFLKTAGRFSTKAFMPSTLSSDTKVLV